MTESEQNIINMFIEKCKFVIIFGVSRFVVATCVVALSERDVSEELIRN